MLRQKKYFHFVELFRKPNMFLYFLYIAVIFILAVTIWWWYFSSTRFWKLCSKIPGPRGLPVIGNYLDFIGGTDKAFRFMIKNYNEYYPIFKFTIPGLCMIVLQDADDIHTVLRSDKTISKMFLYKAVRQILGNNLVTSQKEKWRRDRKRMNPAFSPRVINTYIPIFNEKSTLFISILKNKAGGQEVNINTYLGMLTLDMITETSLGVDSQIQEQNKVYMLQLLEKWKEFIQKCITNFLYCVDIVYQYSEICKENVKNHEDYLKFIREIIRERVKFYQHREKIQISERETSGTQKNKLCIFFDHVFESTQRAISSHSVSGLENEVLFLTAAGTDTTAFTLSACFMLLAIHGDIQDKVVKEIEDILGEDLSRLPEYEDLKKMVYIDQVLKETMRLFSVVIFTGRRADEDIKIGGYIIPAGADIVISPYLLHRDPRYFPDPLKFDPERFSSEKIGGRNPHCFIPFLFGPRMCIGHYYAMVTMKIIITHALRNFEILPCCTREEMEEVNMSMVLSFKNGYNVRLKQRNLNEL